ncbi:MAG TPA: aminoglycoside phosphotransferase family protein [Candidatus Udaeobacter sp.]|nr:aminoglycoside phosphotransferase family protein [Candidatus Udaeobacter sp.]
MNYEPMYREAGHFQQSLKLDDIVKVCSIAFAGENKILEIIEMGSGFFNNTYCITFQDYFKVMLRVSPNYPELLYSHENHLMRGEYLIQPYFSVIGPYIPRVLFADFSRKHIDRDYMFQSFIEGLNWGELQDRLSQEENESIWKQLGTIVNRINEVTNQHFGIPYPAPHYDKWSGYFINLLENKLQDIHRFKLLDAEMLEYIGLVKQCIPWLDDISEAKLCHGDLWPNNILVKQSEAGLQISGILDMERAYWGDPMAEWTFSHFEYPERFWNTFGDRKDDSGEKIRKLIYKGDLFANAILESVRFKYDPPNNELNAINMQLRGMLQGLSKD